MNYDAPQRSAAGVSPTLEQSVPTSIVPGNKVVVEDEADATLRSVCANGGEKMGSITLGPQEHCAIHGEEDSAEPIAFKFPLSSGAYRALIAGGGFNMSGVADCLWRFAAHLGTYESGSFTRLLNMEVHPVDFGPLCDDTRPWAFRDIEVLGTAAHGLVSDFEMAANGTLAAFYLDSDCSDNTGSETIEIYRCAEE